MKKNALMILLAGLVSFGAFAQDKPERKKPTPEKVAEWKTNRLKETVGLNDDQYKKLYAFHLDKAKKDEAKRTEMHAKMKAERAEVKKQYASVLSPEQLKKLEAAHADRGGKKRGDFKGRGGEKKRSEHGTGRK